MILKNKFSQFLEGIAKLASRVKFDAFFRWSDFCKATYIPNVVQELVFCCVGFAANFSPSLAPCARTMVARSRKKIGAAFLQNSQLLNHVRYTERGSRVGNFAIPSLLFSFLSALLLLAGCGTHAPQDHSSIVISMQIIDRNGFAETISNKERISTYKGTDFLNPQPYQKVLRVFGRNAEGKSSAKITSYHDNGQIWQYLEVTNGRANGFYREWFPNGQLKIESFVIEGLADILDLAQRTWVFDGLSRVWDDQANLLAEIHYQKGELHSASRYYHPNGALQKIIPYEAGLIEGDVLSYDAKGFLLEQIPYSSGKKHGRAICYWSKECCLYVEIYDQDLLLEASYYDSFGKQISSIKEGIGKQAEFKGKDLYALTEFTDGVPEGLVMIFNSNGALQCTYELKEGKKNGEEWEYYPSKKEDKPQPKLCVHWHDDKLQGIIKTWYPNNVMESQREIIGNKKQGVCFSWYANADLMFMEEYENDFLVKASYFKKGDKMPVSKIEGGKGVATLYKGDGVFLRKVSYEKGVPKLDDGFE